MNETTGSALATLATHAARLGATYRFDWPDVVQQAVQYLRYAREAKAEGNAASTLAALVGGASSGKSTIFNNLMGGSPISRITARSHATRGLILAVHEDALSETSAESATPAHSPAGLDDLLLPDLERQATVGDQQAEGAPGVLTVCTHELEDFAGVLLFDTPDFTSEAARQEGDLLLASLPWFDRLIIVIDRERWFDRQSLSMMKARAAPFASRKMVIFNCTEATELTDADRARLQTQADRLGAEKMIVLEHRLGRGLCRFPPVALDGVRAFLREPAPDRRGAVLRSVAEAAQLLLNQNQERRHRLERLRTTLTGAVRRELPTARACMIAMMNVEERRNLDVVSRVLRVREAREWFTSRTRRIGEGLRRMPYVGAMFGPANPADDRPDDDGDRVAIAHAHFETTSRRHVRELNRLLEASLFWNELRQWTGLGPAPRSFEWIESLREQIHDDALAFDRAMNQWTEKVASECAGFTTNVKGAIGASALGIAIVLIAVPGPLGVLTLAAAKGALIAAAGKLAAATGAGALLGKHAGRLADVVAEKLVGSKELGAVEAAAQRYCDRIEAGLQTHVEQAFREASELTLPADGAVIQALETISAEGGADQ